MQFHVLWAWILNYTGNGDLAFKAQQGDQGIKLKLGRYGFKALNAEQFAQTQHRHPNHLIQKGSGYLVSLG
jgi:hypothetical protein